MYLDYSAHNEPLQIYTGFAEKFRQFHTKNSKIKP